MLSELSVFVQIKSPHKNEGQIFPKDQFLKMDLMLNLLFQHAMGLPQENNEVHLVKGSKGSLEHVYWGTEKADFFLGSPFSKVGF